MTTDTRAPERKLPRGRGLPPPPVPRRIRWPRTPRRSLPLLPTLPALAGVVFGDPPDLLPVIDCFLPQP